MIILIFLFRKEGMILVYISHSALLNKKSGWFKKNDIEQENRSPQNYSSVTNKTENCFNLYVRALEVNGNYVVLSTRISRVIDELVALGNMTHWSEFPFISEIGR